MIIAERRRALLKLLQVLRHARYTALWLQQFILSCWRTVRISGKSTKRRCILGTLLLICAVITLHYALDVYRFNGALNAELLLQSQLLSNITESVFSNSSAGIVVCMIFTTPSTWDSRARAVRNTWGRRCHIPVYFYSRGVAVDHPILKVTNAVGLNIREGRNHLTGKTMAALRFSLLTYGNVAQWFMKVDDDTFVIWENLEHMLSSQNSSTPRYIGYVFRHHLPTLYASGGGYLLSKEAVRMIVNAGHGKCAQYGAIEDLDIGRCMANLGVFPWPAIGPDGKLLMHADNPIDLLDGSAYYAQFYYYKLDELEIGTLESKGVYKVLSRETVTLHRISPGQMYLFDFLLYKLQRYHPTESTNSTSVCHRTHLLNMLLKLHDNENNKIF